MPASLTSTANPVGVFGTDAGGVTTIIWNTGGAQRGRVYLTVTKGGAVSVSDLLFSGNASIGDTAGSKTLSVAFGSTYSLSLRDVANNAVLASLTVTVEDIQPALLGEALRWAALDKKFNPPQAIYNLKVTADIAVESFFVRADVVAQVQQAVADLLAFDRVGFNQTIYLSRFYEETQSVPGVVFVNITEFRRGDRAAPLIDPLGTIVLGPNEVPIIPPDAAYAAGLQVNVLNQGGQ